MSCNFSETYIEREPKESSNDRNDRAIRKAVTWYENHLAKSTKETSRERIKVVLLTDDLANREKAKFEGLTAFSAQEYVRSLKDAAAHLQDKLCLKEYGNANSTPIYPPHLTLAQIHEGIKSSKLYQGSFVASRENFLEGSVNVECFEKFVSYFQYCSKEFSISQKFLHFIFACADPHPRT